MKLILAHILKAKGWTKYRLGKETGISSQVLSHWSTKGASSINLKHLVRLKDTIGSWKALGDLIERQVEVDE